MPEVHEVSLLRTQGRRQCREVSHDEVGWMGRVPCRPLATIDPCGPHPRGFRPDTIKGMVRDMHDPTAVLADDLCEREYPRWIIYLRQTREE